MTAVSEHALHRSETQPDSLHVSEEIACIVSTAHVLTTVLKGRRYEMRLPGAGSFAAEPLSSLVSINLTAAIYAPSLRSGAICLNVPLPTMRRPQSAFAGGTETLGEDWFEAGTWRDTRYGLPAMPHAIASLDCTIASTMSLGTHTAFDCKVRGLARHDDTAALLYTNRASACTPPAPISGF